MATFVRFLLRHRRLAFLAIGLSLCAAAFSALSIQVRFQFRDLYDYPANKNLPLFKEDVAMFGDPAGYVVALVEAPDVFQPEVLSYVRRLTSALEPEQVFKRVRSLTNVNAIRGSQDSVTTGPLVRDIPADPQEVEALRRYVLGSRLFVRRLVSQDATATAVLAEMRFAAAFSTVNQQREVVDAFARALAATPAPPGIRVRLTGSPSVEIGTTDALLGDQVLLMPAVVVVLSLMLFLTFRTWHGIVLCLSSVSVALLWTAGLFAQLHRPVDLIGSIIPTTMLVYGVVDPIFVLARYREKLKVGRAREDAIVETLSELAVPCFLTSLTTSIGFLAFVTSVSPSLRLFGMTVGLGVVLAFVTTVTVLPLLLSVVPMPALAEPSSSSASGVQRMLRWLNRSPGSRPVTMVVASCLMLALGTWFARDQRIDNEYVGSLPRGPKQTDVRVFEDKLAGVSRMVVTLAGPPGSLKRPEVLQALEQIDHAVEKLPLVTYAASISDLVAEAHAAFQGDGQPGRVPASKSLVAQYLSLIDPADRLDLATEDYARGHIALLMKDRGSKATFEVTRQVERAVAAAQLEKLGVHAVVTGHQLIAYQELDGVVVELLYGVLLAFAVVLAFQGLLFRSLRVPLLSIVPNLLPLVICFATTRAFDVPLRLDTALVSCVCIGGLFNTTIHLFARVFQLISEGERNPDEIVRGAVLAVGPPALFTTIVLACGFAVFVLSHFRGLQMLGVLSGVTLAAGFISDMLFTPAFMRLGLGWEAVLGRGDSQQAASMQPQSSPRFGADPQPPEYLPSTKDAS